MTPPPHVTRGVRALRRLLNEQTFDLRTLDLPGFRQWLQRHLTRWQRDPIFVQRVRIRELRGAHPELSAAEREQRRLAAADAAAPQFPRLRQVEKELRNARKAIDGLQGALRSPPPHKRAALREKRKAFQELCRQLEDEQARLIAASPQRQALLQAEAELQRLRATTGLDVAEEELQRLLRQQGRHRGRSGSSFERFASEVARHEIAADCQRRRRATDDRLIVLHGVTLGAAQVEFDQLLVRRPLRADRPVIVLAAVEVKRNLNDLAHGFLRRQTNLAWLTGEATGYRAAEHRTQQFPAGHFDREARHQQAGETFVFTRRSFRLFQRDPSAGMFLHRLYFISRPGPLWGVSSATLSQISYRVATDERWNLDDDSDLRRLLHWCQSLAEPLESPDVLRLYASQPKTARQILFPQQ